MRWKIVFAVVALLLAGCGGDDAASDDGPRVAELQAEVNRLRAQLDLMTTGTTAAGTGTTAVTLEPGAAVDYVPVFDSIFEGIGARIAEVDDAVQRANAAWEAETASYDDTHARMSQAVADAGAFSDVVGLLPVPAELATRYADAIAAIEEFELAARAVLAGLEAPDDGTLRREAADRLAETATRVLSATSFD
ncbi:MAG: hypothetical protein R3290_06195 [Acidimicrobiia bacterium]|nr:hypothetical protein [Acidimicrobiia bacterium]